MAISCVYGTDHIYYHLKLTSGPFGTNTNEILSSFFVIIDIVDG